MRFIGILSVFILVSVVAAQNCYTCPSGQLHWYELGLPQPADKCACYPTSALNCWTCPSGFKHWYELGLSEPADKCACYPDNTQATNPNCYTCPKGFKHWWELGMAQPADKCACYPVTTPNAPAPSAPAPNAPAPAVSIASTNSMMQRFIYAMTPSATSPGAISFSPCVAPYAPWNPPPYDLVKQLLSNVIQSSNYRTIVVYSLDHYIAEIAQSLGVRIVGVVPLTADWAQNGRNIATGVDAAKRYPDTVLAVSCGNEAGLQYGATPQTAAFINNCISAVRQAGVQQPVGCIDTPNTWLLDNGQRTWTDVSYNADWIGANIYPWFDNMYGYPPYQCNTPPNIGQETYNVLAKIERLNPGKQVLLTESGWPSSWNGAKVASPPNIFTGYGCATASDYDQKTAAQSIVDFFRKVQKPCTIFSAYREAWKGSNSHSVEEFWGLCSGSPPYNCINMPW